MDATRARTEITTNGKAGSMQKRGLSSPIRLFLACALTLVTAHASAEQPPPSDVRPRANLRGRDLSGARFELARLMRADFRGADLSGAVFVAADLSHANFARANLTDVRFINSTLDGANFTGVDFSTNVAFRADSHGRVGRVRLSFAGVNFTNANLSDMNFDGANFTHARLRGTNLRGADLSGTDFTRADLRNADLRNADLTGADLTGANLAGARGGVRCNATTRWPDLFGPSPCD